MHKRVLILGSYSASLIHFRGPLIEEMVSRGHQVVASAPDDDAAVASALAKVGAEFIRIPMKRAELDPFADFLTVRSIIALLHRVRPDAVLATTAKPIVYGSAAQRIAKIGELFAMLEGLGYAFVNLNEPKRILLRVILSACYRSALAEAKAIFVLNGDDAEELLRRKIVREPKKLIHLNGIGVDLAHYAAPPPPTGAITFLMASRLLPEKGVREYAAAAEQLRTRWPTARFLLVGGGTKDASSISEAEIRRPHGAIEYLGPTTDIRPYYAAAHVVVLPSWYREGLPRTLLEGLAAGRAIITTDTPGCRDAVQVGVNGVLVPPRDVAGLVAAMEIFMRNPSLVWAMGTRSRALAEQRFDIRDVNRVILTTMGLL